MKTFVLLAAVASGICLQVQRPNEVAGSLDCLGFVSSVQRYFPSLPNDAVDSADVDGLRQELCISFPQQCEDFLEKLPVAAVLLASNFEAEDLCALLYPALESEVLPSFPVNQPKDSVLCTGCTIVVRIIEFDVRVMNYTTQQIVSAIKGLCAILSPLKLEKQICDDVMNYINDIIQWVLSGASPGDVCIRLKLCNSSTEVQDASTQTDDIILGTEVVEANTALAAESNASSIDIDDGIFEGGLSRETMYPETETGAFDRHHKGSHHSKQGHHHKRQGKHGHHKRKHGQGEHEKHHRHGKHGDHRGHHSHRHHSHHRGQQKHHRPQKHRGYNRFQHSQYTKSKGLGNSYIGFKIGHLFPPRSLFGGISQTLQRIWSNGQDHKVKKEPSAKEVGCGVCKRVVEFIDWEIKHVNASTDQRTEWLRFMCQSIQSDIAREMCGTTFEKVGAIAKMLESQTASDDICEELNLCKEQQQGFPLVEPLLTKSSHCKPMCRQLSSVGNFWIERESKELMDMLADLDDVCAESNLGEKCERAMKLTRKTASDMRLLTAGLASKCRCPTTRLVALRPSFGNMCDVCLMFEQALIDSLAGVNETIGSLVDALRSLCDDVPESLLEKCSLIVNEVEEIAQYIESKLNPSGICKAIGVCDGDEQFKQLPRNLLAMPGLLDTLQSGLPRLPANSGCQFCHRFMENVDKQLLKFGNAEAIKNSLSLVCESKANGTDFSSLCTKMVDGVKSVARKHKKLRNSSLCKMIGIC